MEILECRSCNSKWPEHHYHVESLRRWQEGESHVLFCALCEAEQMKDTRLSDVYTCGEDITGTKRRIEAVPNKKNYGNTPPQLCVLSSTQKVVVRERLDIVARIASILFAKVTIAKLV